MIFLRRFMAATVALLFCLSAVAARADSGPPALELYPDEYPLGVAFSPPSVGSGSFERFTSQPGAWYAIYRMPMHPGKAYDVLVAHTGDPSRMKVYALDSNPLDKASAKYNLNLHRLEFGGRHNTVYGTTIATASESSANHVYLLLEWLPPARNERPIPVVLQAISSDPTGHMPDDRHGMYWSWHDRWQRPLNDFHVESPLQSEKRRYANETPPPPQTSLDQDGQNAPPFRLLPF